MELRIAVLGATGLVGQTILKVLGERSVSVETLVPLATEGMGRHIDFDGREIPVESVDAMDWSRVDVAFFAATSEASAHYAPIASRQGVAVIDKSSYFRMNPEVPLVVPEVNAEAIGDARIIASPNCSTIQMVVALNPIRRQYGIRRIIMSTYQAVSGTGRDAVDTLARENQALVQGAPIARGQVYPTPIAGNVLPFCDAFGEGDFTGEEWKLTRETEKIFAQSIPVSATAVRVPVTVGHAESIYLETEQPYDLSQLRAILGAAASVRVMDDPKHGVVPTPWHAAGQDRVLVGRIRRDLFEPRGLHLFVVADNLRKGAATNAVQIMEVIQHRYG